MDELSKEESNKLKNDFNTSVDLISDALSGQIDAYHEVALIMNQRYNLSETTPIINNLIFFRISFRDIVNATKQLMNASTKADINLCSRALALHLYEFLNDTNDLLGSKLRKSIAGFPDADFLTKELNCLKTYQKSINSLLLNNLKNIRHNAIGHKHQEGIVLNTIIKNIKENEVWAYSIVIWIFCMGITNFQNSLVHSIKMVSANNLSDSPKDVMALKEEIASTRKKLGVDGEFRRFMLMIKGVDIELATLFCTMTPEELNNEAKSLLELKDYLDTDKSDTDLQRRVKIIQDVKPEILAIGFKFPPEKVKELVRLRELLATVPKDELHTYRIVK
jgi:hypothetical protein